VFARFECGKGKEKGRVRNEIKRKGALIRQGVHLGEALLRGREVALPEKTLVKVDNAPW
jgi:hypothetical protein